MAERYPFDDIESLNGECVLCLVSYRTSTIPLAETCMFKPEIIITVLINICEFVNLCTVTNKLLSSVMKWM